MPVVASRLVAALDALLREPDPADLVSPTGAHRAHILTHAGHPDRVATLLPRLMAQYVATRRGERAGPLDEARP
jgi:hypothetical protein